MDNLKHLRKLSGLTFEGLAKLTGIPAADLNRAERGNRRLSTIDVYLVRRVLTLEIARRAGEIEKALGQTAGARA